VELLHDSSATSDLLRFFSLFALCAWILGCATLCPPPGREAAGNAAGAVTSAASNAPAAAATSPAREKLRADLNTIFSDPRFDNAFWGVRVETAEGEVIYDLNGAKSMNPASNTKLVTTAAALDRLGKDFSYTTRVDAVGEIRNGRLDGDLVIVGSGDPSLGAWHPDDSHDSAKLLAEWAKALKDAGIREISGDYYRRRALFYRRIHFILLGIWRSALLVWLRIERLGDGGKLLPILHHAGQGRWRPPFAARRSGHSIHHARQ
jgi:D-alanyl-D-alanine carboxypeptidase